MQIGRFNSLFPVSAHYLLFSVAETQPQIRLTDIQISWKGIKSYEEKGHGC